ncbi:MAG: CpsD/CapB family tyrosine-protein kinase [Planctomycetota bacterium]|jgi:polysaccharide biosynthesis transport protein|nr:CpsD/CapB family tyrosine-protein kinase [Planctomycetota bacterium]
MWLPFGKNREDKKDKSPPLAADENDLVVLMDSSLDSKLVVYQDPRSFPSEQYRSFRTNLRAMNPGDAPRTLLFTSPAPDEGKSTTVANIALSLAEFQNLKVCLIDMDLRSPKMHEFFDLPLGPGVTDVLMDRTNPRKVLQAGSSPNLSVITAGRPTNKPNEVTASEYVQDFMGFLKQEYNYIVIDTPPCNLFGDAAQIGKLVDGVILVVALGETMKAQADATLETLASAGANVVGSFVTQVRSAEPTVVPDLEDV